MSKTEYEDADWATAAEQSAEEDEAQEGNILAEAEESVEPAEHIAVHVLDENEVAVDLDAALDALVESSDPEADAVVDDALDIDSADEAEAAVEAVEDEEAEADPYEEFRQDLRFLPGKWYVIHSYAGFERRVKQNIENRKASMAMEDYIYQVEVPMEDVVEIKNGQRKMVTRVRIPGYVLVRMDLNEDSWSVVRHTPGVTGFVGNAHNPTPLRFEEAFGMLKSLVEIKDVPAAKGGKGGAVKGAQRVLQAEVDFEIGETITIKEGSFAGLPGSISEIKPESGKLIVLVSLFERETPVELSFDQVTKL
ncbi:MULTISPECIES: transcription termination/antitermination protein NusG [Microterricola]|uniref:Transcription termination/antitermination protein NusG n=2 Tax=Microterricola TaxID=518733 RepID=A0A1H1L9S9_9MICO|nr:MULTISPECIES: transcription termination/antitermination protein NusG [Microterricola]PPL20427.1 transcription termination/antitermination factor NusG [Microterricola pindariensis]SDR71243.1 transcription antitermination protein nusG [Microterricola viridarii]